MKQRKNLAIVLGAGIGSRMCSDRPKVLHEIAGRSMIAHVLATASRSGISRAVVVIGDDMDDVAAEVHRHDAEAEIAIQSERLGTAHAVRQARGSFEDIDDDVIVLYGDTPLVRQKTLMRMREALADAEVVVLGFRAADPRDYGRLLTDANNNLVAIREYADASDAERQVDICNSGVMAFRGQHLPQLLDAIGNDNAKKEYYLTDAVEVALDRNLRCTMVLGEEDEVLGVNSRAQLARAEAIMQQRLRQAAMENGATLIDPGSVTFSHDTVLGRDVIVEPHVFFAPGVKVGNDVRIKAFSHLEQTHIKKGAMIGPFARLRPGAEIGPGAKVGNFVEIKKSRISGGAKVNHLTYIGDADIGEKANIGAGTITCNYDGFNKARTIIGAGAFIGSNSSLIAPVTIGKGAYVGSGSALTGEVEADSLVITRAKRLDRPGWAAGFRRKNRPDNSSTN